MSQSTTVPGVATQSTNVRHSLVEAGARGAFRLLGGRAPELAAALADRLFCTPPSSRPSARVEAVLAGAARRDREIDGVRLATWRWGKGPLVMLVHGWGGVGGQLGAFIEPLVARGFSVLCFDAPGHGRSAGSRSSLVEFARALAGLAEAEGPLHALIAHSLGAAATSFALKAGVRTRRAVFIGAPLDPGAWTDAFAERLGVPSPVMQRMRARVEARLGVRWPELRALEGAASQTTPLLLIHDEDDAEVSVEDSRALAEAWPGARFVATAGLGHRRILRDAAVVAEAVGFAAAGAQPRRGPAEILEAELFDRELRRRRRGPRPLELAASRAR